MHLSHEHRNTKQIADDGNGAGSCVEGEETAQNAAARSGVTLRPGEMFVPEEIVKYRCFDGEGRGPKRADTPDESEGIYGKQLNADSP